MPPSGTTTVRNRTPDWEGHTPALTLVQWYTHNAALHTRYKSRTPFFSHLKKFCDSVKRLQVGYGYDFLVVPKKQSATFASCV